jgi:transcriptional regulator GlxA family with amidase domain
MIGQFIKSPIEFKNLTFIIAIILMGLPACNTRQEPAEVKAEIVLPEVMKPDREWNVAFLIVDGVYNSELVAPMDILHHTVFHTDPGMSVFTVAPAKDPITTFEGLRIIPDFAIEDADLPYIDVLVVPSAENSMGSDLENEILIDFVRKTGASASFTMSLCDGAFVLAKAGLTNDHESTTFPSDIPKYREMFPELIVHEGVSFVHDSDLITSSGGAKSYDPALYLVELLYGRDAAIGVGKGLVIDWDLREVEHLIVK